MSRHTNNKPRAIINDLSAAQTALSSADTKARGTIIAGLATLVNGTVDVAIPGLTTKSMVQVTLHDATGAFGVNFTAQYQAYAMADKIRITALKSDGTLQANDLSTLNYQVVV